jgi:Holliday junction resolvase-like predicted endonuclease
VLDRNVRVGRGELDLLVELAGQRVAIEVKTRWSGDGRSSFTADKQAAVRQAARSLRPPVHRLDLISITLDSEGYEIRWLPRV